MKTKLPKRRPRVSTTDSAWERMKAAGRNVGHDEAVQTVFYLQKQLQTQWSNQMAALPVDLNVIQKTLTKERIPFVLTGARPQHLDGKA